jgi:hypothetical protein
MVARFDIIIGNMPFSIIRTFRNLQSLRIPAVWVPQTPGLNIRKLIVERRWVPLNCRYAQSTIERLPRLTSLTLLFGSYSQNRGPDAEEDSPPYFDFSTLESLKVLLVRGDVDLGYTKSKAVKDLVFPELETLEFHWCPPRLLKGAQFPSLKYYSESIELGWEEGDYCTTALAVVRAHMDQLRIIVL